MTVKAAGLLTPAKLREYLAVSKPTYLAFVKDGMPVIKLNAKTWRFDRQAVMAWLDERQRKAAPTSGDA